MPGWIGQWKRQSRMIRLCAMILAYARRCDGQACDSMTHSVRRRVGLRRRASGSHSREDAMRQPGAGDVAALAEVARRRLADDIVSQSIRLRPSTLSR